MWKNLPAFGLYVRHVRELAIHGFRLHLSEADDRAPIWADDVQDLRIEGAWITGTVNVQRPFVYIRDVENEIIEPPHQWRREIIAAFE